MESKPIKENTPLLGSSSRKNISPWNIVIPMSVLTFSSSIIFAPLVQLYTLIYCYRYNKTYDLGGDISLENCLIPEIQSLAAEAQAIIMFLTYSSTLIFASYYGSLSDIKGRRIVLGMSTIGSILVLASYIITYHHPDKVGVYLLYIAPVLHGFLAGDRVLIATAQAYISDCTTPSTRTIAFGQLLGGVFIGTTIGPTIGSFLLKQTHSIISVFYVSGLFKILFLLYISFLLPESKPNPGLTKPKGWLEHLNLTGTLQILHHHQSLSLLTIIQFCLTFVSLPPTLLYAMLKFDWSAYEGGFFISAVSSVRVLTTLVILPCLTRWLGPVDQGLIRAGVLIETVSFVLLGLAGSSGSFTAFGALHSVGILSFPSIRSSMIGLVDPSQVGQLMGALAVVESVAMILSQLGINLIYSASVATMPELSFYICAGICGISLVLTYFVFPLHKTPSTLHV